LDIEQIRKILHKILTGTIQLFELSLPFCLYVKAFMYRVEGMSIYIIL